MKASVSPIVQPLSAPRSEWLVVPWPPTSNLNVRHARGAHYLTKEHKAFRAEVFGIVLERKLRQLVGRLRVSIDACPPDRRRRDIDNIIKPILDALQHAGMYVDDNQIDHLTVSRRKPDGKSSGVSVTIEEQR